MALRGRLGMIECYTACRKTVRIGLACYGSNGGFEIGDAVVHVANLPTFVKYYFLRIGG